MNIVIWDAGARLQLFDCGSGAIAKAAAELPHSTDCLLD